MIVKLTVEQITSLWDSIRYSIISSISHISKTEPKNIRNILCQLLRQDLQCWCVFDGNKKIYGYITTTISIDSISKSRTLLIYSLFLFHKATDDMWKDGIEALEKYAKANKCNNITAYSTNPIVISIAEKQGYSNCTYLSKLIGD